MTANLPKAIRITAEKAGGHLQGIAIDRERKYLYCSFTTCLIKSDLDGNIVGSVTGLAGHLGCIAYNYQNGRVYGSLEFKHDKIGKGILDKIGYQNELKDGFYIVSFDTDKITALDMDAEKDGVMTAVFLKEVYDDYSADGHRYGCSGIDGVTFAPDMGSATGRQYLFVAYGIYKDVNRRDNDNQIILKYDISGWDKFEAPLDQLNMHRNGPAAPDSKYFLHTGNTTYGIQNLEYDPSSDSIIAAVYKGDKKNYVNYSTFFISTATPPERKIPVGLDEEQDVIFLTDFKGGASYDTPIGSHFPLGTTGIISLSDGDFYVADSTYENGIHGGVIELYRLDKSELNFKKI